MISPSTRPIGVRQRILPSGETAMSSRRVPVPFGMTPKIVPSFPTAGRGRPPNATPGAARATAHFSFPSGRPDGVERRIGPTHVDGAIRGEHGGGLARPDGGIVPRDFTARCHGNERGVERQVDRAVRRHSRGGRSLEKSAHMLTEIDDPDPLQRRGRGVTRGALSGESLFERQEPRALAVVPHPGRDHPGECPDGHARERRHDGISRSSCIVLGGTAAE